MARQRRTFESYVEEAKAKIREKPQIALKEIGKLLVREIKKATPKSRETRSYTLNGRSVKVKPGRLRKSIGYWFRRREGDLQVGSKAFYAHFIEFGTSKQQKEPFILPTVIKHKDTIQEIIEDALKELRRS